MTIDQAMELAIQHHQAGRLAEAEKLYRTVLENRPDHAGALNLLGVLTAQKEGTAGHDAAEDLLRRAIALCPSEASYHSNLGKILQDKGDLTQAIAAVREAVRLKPDLAEAHVNLGVMLAAQGRHEPAIAAFRDAVRVRPDAPLFHSYLAGALQNAGRLEEALAGYREAARLAPDYGAAYAHMGDIYRSRGEFNQAIACYQQLVRLEPHSADAHNWLGASLCAREHIDDAAAELCLALRLNPAHAEAQSNLGLVLQVQGELDASIHCCRTAVQLDPTFAPGHNNLGNAYQSQGRIDEALACFRRAMELQPGEASYGSNLLLALHYHAESTGQQLYDEARRWAERHADPLIPAWRPHSNDRNPERRLRVGYMSPDFMGHPVSSFLRPLMEAHDHQHFNIFCYSDVAAPDQTTASLRACADTWRNIVGLSDEAVTTLVRQDQIDILIDLSGHTRRNRLLVFARKPAPVQVSYLGYPGTTGMRAMDYRLTDDVADPAATSPQGMSDTLHTEILWRLPSGTWCFAAPGNAPDPTPTRPLAANANNAGICFGCFNNFAKVSPIIADLWARILNAVPGAHLLLKARGLHDPATQGHIRDLLAAKGIDPHRLDLRGVQRDPRQHLATYSEVDIALDTYPYHGTTTTCEALWMGVPVVTMAGSMHVSRVGASLLTRVGFPELIARSPEDYVSIAAGLAKNRAQLVEFRDTLRARMQASPLMQGRSFARDVENAYREMWRRWCIQDHPPSAGQPASR